MLLTVIIISSNNYLHYLGSDKCHDRQFLQKTLGIYIATGDFALLPVSLSPDIFLNS